MIVKYLFLVGILLIVVGNAWAAVADTARNESVPRYTACVMREYGTSPARYRLEHGVYPLGRCSK